jgi:hypothetical protein
MIYKLLSLQVWARFKNKNLQLTFSERRELLMRSPNMHRLNAFELRFLEQTEELSFGSKNQNNFLSNIEGKLKRE